MGKIDFGLAKALAVLVVLSASVLLFSFLNGGFQSILNVSLLIFFVGLGHGHSGGVLLLHRLRAQVLLESEAPEIFLIVRKLCSRSGIPMPKLYWIPAAHPNLLSLPNVSGSRAMILTQGLPELLNAEELEGVFAHALVQRPAHGFLISLVSNLSNILFFLLDLLRLLFRIGTRGNSEHSENALVMMTAIAIHGTVLGMFKIFASPDWKLISDEKSLNLVKNSLYLASALTKMDAARLRLPNHSLPLSLVPLWILSPTDFSGWRHYFNPFPPLDERIFRLEKRAYALQD